MKSKKTIYPEILGEKRKHNPYFIPNHPPISKEQENPLIRIAEALIISTNKKEFEKDCEMLEQLFKHYKIDITAEDRWMRLSYNLALDNVPCFSYETAPRGCPKKWDNKRNALLVAHVNTYLEEHPSHSAKDACRLLAKKNTFGSNKTNSLYTRYMEAKKT